MNRTIFGLGLLLSLLIFVAALRDTWSNSSQVPEEVSAGFAVWQSYGCESCHTLYGQGGNYAPDLTHIYNLRGETYIREFLVDPSAFHPNQRVMPRLTISQTDTTNLIAMLSWTSNDSSFGADWPPNPIHVSGSGSVFGATSASNSESVSEIDEGRVIYSRLCASCHSIEPDVIIVGPSFWGLAARTIARLPDTKAQDYVRTSILYPSDYVVEGFPDVMQKNLAEVLSSEEIDAVISYVLSVGESEGNNE